jgi:photosystem II stability/assembly factor-like uncharacterized protein
MLTENELTAEIRAGLEAVTPPAPWLAQTVERRLRASRPQGKVRQARGFRLGLNGIALILVITLGMAAAGVFLALHGPMVPARPGSEPVIFPTKMISPTTGWALVGQSELWRTTDAGASWTAASPPHLPDRVIDADLNSFLDGERAIITELGGGRAGSPDFYWVSFRTVDGGRTWQQGNSLQDPSHQRQAQQYFVDANNGWLVMSDISSQAAWPILYSTHDGGLNWSPVASTVTAAATTGTATPCYANVAFASAVTGWLLIALCDQVAPGNFQVTRDLLLVTHDGGTTWQLQALPIILPAGSRFETPLFFDQLHGIVVVHGPKPTLLATSDGGSTWSPRSLPGETQSMVDFVDPSHGWAIAGPSSMFTKNRDDSQRTVSLPLYHTDDGGVTWTPVQTNLRLESPVGVALSNFYFVDQKIGFGILFTLAVGPSQFLRTTDGGHTWAVVQVCKAGLGNSYPPPACPASSA